MEAPARARVRDGAYYAAAVLAAFGLLARALGWGALGAVSLFFWVLSRLGDRYLGQWVAPPPPDAPPPDSP